MKLSPTAKAWSVVTAGLCEHVANMPEVDSQPVITALEISAIGSCFDLVARTLRRDIPGKGLSSLDFLRGQVYTNNWITDVGVVFVPL